MFSDLGGKDARHYFGRFVKKWNEGKLKKHFYDGSLDEDAVVAASTAAHDWGIRAVDAGKFALGRTSTEMSQLSTNRHSRTRQGDREEEGDYDRGGRRHRGRSSSHRRKEERRRDRARRRAVEEELVPVETGHEGRVQRRQAANAAFHAAAAEADDLADGTAVPSSVLMGEGDSLARAKAAAAKKEVWRSARDRKRALRASAAAAKEDSFMADFKARHGL